MNKKIFYLSSTIVSVLIVALLVYAYGGTDSTVHGHSAGEVELVCPTGFTSIEAQGRQLGCMQTAEGNSGTATTWELASDYCFDNYGGRLATTGEWYIAMANYGLTDETDDWEWNDDADYSNGVDQHAASGFGGVDKSTSINDGDSRTVRCFIPN